MQSEGSTFFVPGAGLICSLNPYLKLNLPENLPQSELASALEALSSQDAGPPTPASFILRDPRRRLAWHLLRRPESPPTPWTFVRSRRQPGAKLEIAVSELHEALRRETSGGSRCRVSLWDDLERTWARLADSQAATDEIEAIARSLALPDPSGLTRAVVTAVRSELLPMLHGMICMRTERAAPEHGLVHLARLRARAVGEGGDPRIIRLKMLSGLHVARCLRSRREALGIAVELYRDLIESGEPADLILLGPEASALYGDWIDCQGEPRTAWCRNLLREIENVSRRLPCELGLFALRSRLHCLTGLAEIWEDAAYNAAGVEFARAAALNPDSEEPRQFLEQAKADLVRARDAIELARAQGEVLNTRWERVSTEVEDNFRDVDLFWEGEEARALSAERDRALLGQCALRLGLLPHDPSSQDAVRDVVSALARYGAGEEEFAELHARLLTTHPQIGGSPWGVLEQAGKAITPLTPASLVQALPPPLPLSEQDVTVDLLLETAGGLATEATPSKRGRHDLFDRWVAYPWLFSRKDWLAKTAGVVGLALIVVGLGGRAIRTFHERAQQEAYDSVRAAIAASDSPATIRAALSYLRHSDPKRVDHRKDEITEECARALMDEMVQASRSGRAADLARLTEQAEALKGWINRSNGPEKETP